MRTADSRTARRIVRFGSRVSSAERRGRLEADEREQAEDHALEGRLETVRRRG